MPPSPEQIKTAVDTTLKYRWLLIFSWFWSVLALLFALLLFFLGDLGTQGHQGVAMLVFDTSSIGRDLYRNEHSHSELVRNVKALVPDDVFAPLSITRYLGAYDWYSISYTWVCKGMYRIMKNKDGLPSISSIMVDAKCEQLFFADNLPFSLHQQLRRDLHPSVHGLLQAVPEKIYDLRTVIWIWVTGGICTLLVVVLFPWSFRRQRLLGGGHWCLASCFLAMTSFAIFTAAWCVIEHYASNITTNLINIVVPNTFRILTILCITTMVACFVLGFMGYGGGLLISQNVPKKHGDEESNETDASGYSDLQEVEPIPVEELVSEDLHPGYDGTIPEEPDADNATSLAISQRPMRTISPEPMSENCSLLITEPCEIDLRAKEERRLEAQVKHISEHVAEQVAQQEAMAKICGRGVVKCPACEVELVSQRSKEKNKKVRQKIVMGKTIT